MPFRPCVYLHDTGRNMHYIKTAQNEDVVLTGMEWKWNILYCFQIVPKMMLCGNKKNSLFTFSERHWLLYLQNCSYTILFLFALFYTSELWSCLQKSRFDAICKGSIVYKDSQRWLSRGNYIPIKVDTHRTRFGKAARFFSFHSQISLLLI